MALGMSKQDVARRGAGPLLQQYGYSGAVILATRLAHYSVKKAASLLGIGEDNILVLAQGPDQKACMADLELRIAQCEREAKFIIALIGIAGATETGTVDPLDSMADIATERGIHFHVDAAWGGAFIFSERYRGILHGIERADTITFCAHKQMFTTQGLSLCLYRDPMAAHACSVNSDYQGRVGSYDTGQFTIEGSRAASAIVLHAVIHLLSRNGLACLIEQSMEKTEQFKRLVAESRAFELVGAPETNIVNYRYIPIDLRDRRSGAYSSAENERISRAVEVIQEQQFLRGKTFVSRTEVLNKAHAEDKVAVFRVVLSNPLTSCDDLLEVLEDQIEIAGRYVEGGRRPFYSPGESRGRSLNGSKTVSSLVPIGRPIANTKVYILDENHQFVPPGVPGEIFVAGDWLPSADGRLSSHTRPGSVISSLGDGEMLLRTGDLGRFRPDGNIEFMRRAEWRGWDDGDVGWWRI